MPGDDYPLTVKQLDEIGQRPSPEEVVARVIADGRHIKDGETLIGRATRRKAAAVTAALRKAGWRILR